MNRNEEIIQTQSHLRDLFSRAPKVFPQVDCDKLLSGTRRRYRYFADDLASHIAHVTQIACDGGLYFLLLGGYSEGRREWLEKSFFDANLRFDTLEPVVTAQNTPDLYATLEHDREIRANLLKLLELVSAPWLMPADDAVEWRAIRDEFHPARKTASMVHVTEKLQRRGGGR